MTDYAGNMSLAYDKLTSGDILGGLLEGAGVLGNIFYVFIILIIIVATYNSTESPQATGFVMLLLSGVGLSLNVIGGTNYVSVYLLLILIMAVGLGLVVFEIFKRGR